ncbi:MAG TPA: ketopantoate reductase C-terminal domain-containing protein [Nevskiaceae bacterium]|nr:ketopantoate reductase C-terminal domain-containing protein [Nevskiaceae bacterium]
MNLIVGAGAVGTILATYLRAAGRPVRLLIRERDRAAYEAATEIRTHAINGPAVVAPKPEITTQLDLDGIDHLFICVKFPALDALLAQLPATLPPNLTLISTLNGLAGLRRIRERFPSGRIVPMSVMYNGQLLGPLHGQITTKALVIIGSDDPKLLGLFQGSGMAVKQAAGESAAWGKLLINLANAVCALTHTTFKDLFTRRELRDIYADVLDEAVATLERAKIRYELPMPMPYRLYRRILRHGGPLPWWFAKLRNRVQPGSYPSMVADIEQGRKTEVDQLNGEIVAVGAGAGVPTPINTRIVELVHESERHHPAKYLMPETLRRQLAR